MQSTRSPQKVTEEQRGPVTQLAHLFFFGIPSVGTSARPPLVIWGAISGRAGCTCSLPVWGKRGNAILCALIDPQLGSAHRRSVGQYQAVEMIQLLHRIHVGVSEVHGMQQRDVMLLDAFGPCLVHKPVPVGVFQFLGHKHFIGKPMTFAVSLENGGRRRSRRGELQVLQISMVLIHFQDHVRPVTERPPAQGQTFEGKGQREHPLARNGDLSPDQRANVQHHQSQVFLGAIHQLTEYLLQLDDGKGTHILLPHQVHDAIPMLRFYHAFPPLQEGQVPFLFLFFVLAGRTQGTHQRTTEIGRTRFPGRVGTGRRSVGRLL
mmetsp:Transcript_20176/g.51503  ORF Transcript_20176/g.51503 Transcript_20176/m.51503 type:complete len:320 (-) Transcript_20176:1967-2926(-)